MKLIHLSDIHATDQECPEYSHLEAIVDYIVEHRSDAVVIITGDLVDHGHRYEFEAVYSLLAYLRSGVRLLRVCPGNHDVEVYGTMGKLWQKLDRKPWRDFYCSLFGDAPSFPLETVVDGAQIIMLDTTAEAGGFEDLARGRVGYAQRTKLAELLEQGGPHSRVVCGHHDLYVDDPTLELDDAAEVRATLSGRCDMYLGGHNHRWAVWREVEGIGWIADAGKSTEPTDDNQLEFRVFNIENGEIDVERERIPVEQP
jgi:3',5'-cyclic AMP phosphodiesterase CpdA